MMILLVFWLYYYYGIVFAYKLYLKDFFCIYLIYLLGYSDHSWWHVCRYTDWEDGVLQVRSSYIMLSCWWHRTYFMQIHFYFFSLVFLLDVSHKNDCAVLFYISTTLCSFFHYVFVLKKVFACFCRDTVCSPTLIWLIQQCQHQSIINALRRSLVNDANSSRWHYLSIC
jgi:hypothetical protein